MALSSPDDLLLERLSKLLKNLPDHPQGKSIARTVESLLRIAEGNTEDLDWKIMAAAVEDLEQGFAKFFPHRHTRKIAIFGSARTPSDRDEYKMAQEFARRIAQAGFMVITGAGGGIMQAGNEGAGRDNSFGLNIRLPFEQGANKAIKGDDKLIDFKYFFTRKLFFLKESDAVALFPGGFGTQDEAFETLTLCQTGKYGPVPLVLIDKPEGDYWRTWNNYVCSQLKGNGLISDDDPSLYTVTDNIDVACKVIKDFYRVYHSSRYIKKLFVIRLKLKLSEEMIEQLNQDFKDIVTTGKITQGTAFPEERQQPDIWDLPRLSFYFNQKSLGRLHQLIATINSSGVVCKATEHPEVK